MLVSKMKVNDGIEKSENSLSLDIDEAGKTKSDRAQDDSKNSGSSSSSKKEKEKVPVIPADQRVRRPSQRKKDKRRDSKTKARCKFVDHHEEYMQTRYVLFYADDIVQQGI